MLAAGNVSAAVAAITAIADTKAALEALAQLCKRAYLDLKSVPTMTAIAWETVWFGPKCAHDSPDPESASRYKGRARAIAYNAGANCWPGWGDAVEIKPADIAEGLKLAERSYELVGELGLGDKAISTSLWLVGALQMATGRLSTAIAQIGRILPERGIEALKLRGLGGHIISPPKWESLPFTPESELLSLHAPDGVHRRHPSSG